MSGRHAERKIVFRRRSYQCRRLRHPGLKDPRAATGLHEMKRLLVPLFLALSVPTLWASDARVAFLGDSITYDGRWPALVESALRATPQFADADIVNFGLPSETVSGLSEE